MPFRALLQELVKSLPQVRGAIFCDYEGENVDLAIAAPQPPGCEQLSDFDLKICGAQVAEAWSCLQQTFGSRGAGAALELQLGCAGGTLLCHAIRDGYYLLLLLAPGRPSAPAAFALRQLAARVELEI